MNHIGCMNSMTTFLTSSVNLFKIFLFLPNFCLSRHVGCRHCEFYLSLSWRFEEEGEQLSNFIDAKLPMFLHIENNARRRHGHWSRNQRPGHAQTIATWKVVICGQTRDLKRDVLQRLHPSFDYVAHEAFADFKVSSNVWKDCVDMDAFLPLFINKTHGKRALPL